MTKRLLCDKNLFAFNERPKSTNEVTGWLLRQEKHSHVATGFNVVTRRGCFNLHVTTVLSFRGPRSDERVVSRFGLPNLPCKTKGRFLKRSSICAESFSQQLSQQPFSAAILSSFSQQLFSAAFLSSNAQYHLAVVRGWWPAMVVNYGHVLCKNPFATPFSQFVTPIRNIHFQLIPPSKFKGKINK